MTDPFAPSWFQESLSLELAVRNRDRSPWRAARLHYSSDLEPEACRRKIFYSLRHAPEPLPTQLMLTSRLGDMAEEVAMSAIKRAGRLVATQVRVQPLRPSAWCWEGTLDALVKDPDGRLVVVEVKSVEPEIAELLHKTGRLDLARRERHLYQVAAYKSGIAEKVGSDLGHRLIFIPRGDGPVVEMEPVLPTLEQVIEQEVSRAALLPRPDLNAGSLPEPARLPLVERPRKRAGHRWEAQAPCRWCSWRKRCGIEAEVERANMVERAHGDKPVDQQLQEAAQDFLSGVGEPVPATGVAGTWSFDDEPAPPKPPILEAPARPVSEWIGDEAVASEREHEWKEQGDEAKRIPFGKLCRKCVMFVPAGSFTDEPCVRRLVPLESFKTQEGFPTPAPIYQTASLDGVLVRKAPESPMETEDERLVRELCDIENGLTEFEVEFVESISRWVEQGRGLTDKQRAVVERILREKGP